MKKANKIVVIAFVILVSITVIAYFSTRQNPETEGSLVIKGAVSNPEILTVSQIEAFPPVTVQVTVRDDPNPAYNGVFNYSGVTLKVLLDQSHISPSASSVFIQALDNYAVTLSIQDAEKATTILAYQKDGAPMPPLSAGGEGPIRLVIGDQGAPHDWVKDVTLIEVK